MTEWFSHFVQYRTDVLGLLFPEFILYSLVGLLAISIIRSTLKALGVSLGGSSAKSTAPKARRAQCAGCGWSGEIVGYRRVCPRCGQSNFVE